jgi:5-methylcytosine-specific restriction endonuclease McrA
MSSKAGDARSSAAWKRLRARLIAQATHCAVCGMWLDKDAAPRTRWRPSVDHILPLIDHPHLAYDPANLRVVHTGCNSRLSNQARRGHADRIGGKPRHWPPRRQWGSREW